MRKAKWANYEMLLKVKSYFHVLKRNMFYLFYLHRSLNWCDNARILSVVLKGAESAWNEQNRFAKTHTFLKLAVRFGS